MYRFLMMKRFLSILFWSIITAAFIGPGTVTTAASSGARFGYDLLWALLFSTIACLVLQEASARVTVVSGLSLGEAIRQQFHSGLKGFSVLVMVLGAIVFGCAAYQTGNILGGVTGAVLGTGLSAKLLTLLVGGIAAVLLWLGSPRTVAYVLSIVVAFMGLVFLVTAFLLKPPLAGLLSGTLIPSLPRGSGLLVLGLIGTTVVPYNLFLGSGLAKGQTLPELRFGLSVAILLGGLISMGILVVGAAIETTFSFEALAATLSGRLGPWGGPFFAFGLFAAGMSSAVTAPLAAAMTARSLFEKADENHWHVRSWRYRSIWMGVLLVGVGFGLADVQPIPAIILAQALNGVVLPFVAVFLILVVNDRNLMGERGLNSFFLNTIMSAVVVVTLILGIMNIAKAVASTLGFSTPAESFILISSLIVSLIIAIPLARAIQKRRFFI
ncbi:divalent metal cation transporter [candidate division KSB1 bacterium]|nr:divalent metal cation transporter [candidate division KSB1 bacterium]